MTALLQAELIKLRTTRTFAALAGAAIATSLLLTALTASLADPTEETVLNDVFASDTSSLFILVLAAVGITGEWRHRTMASSILAAPDRLRFLAAKTLAYAAAGALLSIAISLAVAALGAAILTGRDLPLPHIADLATLAGRGAVITALLAAIGVQVGALARNQAVSIVALLVILFVVEPTLLALAPDVGRFGPLVALPTAVGDVSSDGGFGGDVDLLPRGLAILAMLGWSALLYAAAGALLKARDLE